MSAANLEVIKPIFGKSFTVKHYLEGSQNDGTSFWHFHPEVELVYIKGGKGMRHIGNHLSHYDNGDLVLIGSNLPHNGFTDRLTGNKSEVIVQFKKQFLGKDILDVPEMTHIAELLQLSLNGIAFGGITKRQVGREMEKLSSMEPLDALLHLAKILQMLALSKDKKILNASGYSFKVKNQDSDRAVDIFNYIKNHFKSNIPLDEIAEVSNLTVPSFCRYFKELTDKTFTQFVNEYRIHESCKLLSDDNESISNISFKVGFNSIAHFNKHFKLVTGKAPSTYRKEAMKYMSLEETTPYKV